ncbi:MAG: hypothetical protein V3U87_08370 [Methylococcaceae bacterium]
MTTNQECDQTTETEIPLRYNLNFDSSGNITIANTDRQLISGQRVKFPIDCKKILNVRNIQIFEIEGSHYIIVDNGGTLTKYPLSHE